MSLSVWLKTHNISYEVCAAAVSRYLAETEPKRAVRAVVRGSTLRRWSLPADHPDRRTPREQYIRALYVITGGAVEPSNLVALPVLDPALRRKAADMLAAARAHAVTAQHRGRAKGAKMSARSRAKMRGQARRAGA
jgi:hypothetical protein